MKNGTSDPIVLRHFRQRFPGQIRLKKFVQGHQRGRGIAAPSTETGAVWNPLFELD